MNPRSKSVYLFFTILCVVSFSGCNLLTHSARTEISGPLEKVSAVEYDNSEAEEIADDSAFPEEDAVAVLSLDNDDASFSEDIEDFNQEEDDAEDIAELGDQELIDSALGYCEASSDFLEQGDADNAIDALDKAYSLMLKVEGTDDPELLQQREDIRLTISKCIMEVYSTRYNTVNGNGKAIPLEMNSYVKKEIESFQGKERTFFIEAYVRSGRYRPAIVRALKEAGFPEELSWLPLIESGFKVRAQSTARALGMWQFIASTGYRYGLTRDTWIDERMDPAKSTAAAIGYLSDLHGMFGDWMLALAAYNCGEKRVANEINRQKNSLLDEFWDLYQRLPSETARYVPRFLAVLHIINDPETYGFDLPEVDEEESYEEITVNKQLDLKTIAQSLEVDSEEIKNLNPELRRNATPKSAYSLKIPVGKGDTLLTKLNELPVYYPTVAETTYEGYHKVRSGETLSSIAKKYGTSVKAIMRANNLSNPNYLKVGMKLKISSGTKAASASSASSQTTTATYGSSGSVTEYVVKRGDSLYKIAKNYNTTIQDLKVLNGLSGTRLDVGQKLIISSGSSVALKDIETRKYTVQKGDSPYIIAKRYNMDLSEFLRVNDLSPQSTIFPGQVVMVASE